MEIDTLLKETNDLLRELITSRRNFVLTICTISAAITAFSIQLFLSAFINYCYLLWSIIFFLSAIIVGVIYYKYTIEKDLNDLSGIRGVAIKFKFSKSDAEKKENAKEGMEIIEKIEGKKNKKDYILDVLVVLLSIGVVLFLLALIF